MTWTDYPTDAIVYEITYEDIGEEKSLLYRCVAQNESAAMRCIQACAIRHLVNRGITPPFVTYREVDDE